MLWTIFIVLLIMWLLGFTMHIGGGLIHLLLVVGLVVPDLCTEFGLAGDSLLNFGPPRFCQIGFGTSTEDLPL